MKIFLLALCLGIALASSASAQITIEEFPVSLGVGEFISGEYIQYDTQNEDGSNTTAIQALIDASGEDQTYDLTAITYETTFSDEYAFFAGAIDPNGSGEVDPAHSDATLTLALPYSLVEEGNEYEGVITSYVEVASDASYNLGGYFYGTRNGADTEFTTTHTPDGDKDFVFPMTMGTTWSSEFTQRTVLGASSFDSDIERTYEVDGWGKMLFPGVAEPIDVLRVKVTTTQEFVGVEFTEVCYDLRLNAMIGAYFCEGSFGDPPTASATFFGIASTDTEPGTEASALTFDAVYPNPTRDAAGFSYKLPTGGAVTLKVYDVLGREVYTVVEGAQPAGVHTHHVNVQNLVPGAYVARLEAEGASQSRSFTVVR